MKTKKCEVTKKWLICTKVIAINSFVVDTEVVVTTAMDECVNSLQCGRTKHFVD